MTSNQRPACASVSSAGIERDFIFSTRSPRGSDNATLDEEVVKAGAGRATNWMNTPRQSAPSAPGPQRSPAETLIAVVVAVIWFANPAHNCMALIRLAAIPATPPPSRAGRWDATSFKVEPLSGLETPYGTLMAQGCTGDRPAIRRPQTERGQNRVETVRGRQSRA